MNLFVTRQFLLSLATIGIAIGWSQKAATAITYRAVALSGQSAPGVPDGTLSCARISRERLKLVQCNIHWRTGLRGFLHGERKTGAHYYGRNFTKHQLA